MTTTLYYSTATTLYVHACGMTATIEMGHKQLNEVLDFVQHIYDDDTFIHGDSVESIQVVDTNTGELLADCVPDKEINNDTESWPTPKEIFDDWGYNEDMGYDPYLGCYSDDC